MAAGKHRWRFFRAGGVEQVVLESGADIAHLAELDQKLWVAIACPTKGTEIDERTLTLIDADRDGRIRPPEILDAIAWSKSAFKSLDLLLEPGDVVALDAFSDSSEGKALRAAAKRILKERGKKAATEISLEDVSGFEAILAEARFNGDGIVPADAAEAPEDRAVIEDIVKTIGSTTDRSGKPGVDRKQIDAFFAEIDAWLAWDAQGRGDDVLALGAATAAAMAAVEAVSAKVDDYFVRCRLAALDGRAAAALNPSDAELAALSPRALANSSEEIEKLPIARVEAARALPLDRDLNPAWSTRVGVLAEVAVGPIVGQGKKTLTESEWTAIHAKLGGYRGWLAAKPKLAVDALGAERIRALADPSIRERLVKLAADDAEPHEEFSMMASVEKAVRYRRELSRVLHNFVNFAEFYRGNGATFQVGTLYLDARSCDLVVEVESAAKHAALAGLSGAYLAYCDCTRRPKDAPADAPVEKKTIVAVFTAGDTDDLMVGRNGVFYDRKGNDWDATITSIIENPISIRQAFFTPYKRLVRLIEEQIAKRAAAKEKASSADIEGAATAAAHADETPVDDGSAPAPGAVAAAATPPAPAPAATAAPAPAGAPAAAPMPAGAKRIDVGTVAALGVAIAGVATFASTIIATFLGLGVWMPIGIATVILAISGPSMLIAWLKLRRRNLGPILDANGWAVNNRAKINVPFGRSLTHLAKLPEGSSRTFEDPYAERPSRWRLWVALAVVVILAGLWALGKLDAYLPDKVRSNTVLHRTPVAAPSGAAPAGAGPAPSAPAPAAK